MRRRHHEHVSGQSCRSQDWPAREALRRPAAAVPSPPPLPVPSMASSLLPLTVQCPSSLPSFLPSPPPSFPHFSSCSSSPQSVFYCFAPSDVLSIHLHSSLYSFSYFFPIPYFFLQFLFHLMYFSLALPSLLVSLSSLSFLFYIAFPIPYFHPHLFHSIHLPLVFPRPPSAPLYPLLPLPVPPHTCHSRRSDVTARWWSVHINTRCPPAPPITRRGSLHSQWPPSPGWQRTSQAPLCLMHV